jgi:cytochrome c2
MHEPEKNMGIKVPVVFVITFVIIVLVLTGRPGSSSAVTVTETDAPTEVVAAPTEVIEPTRIPVEAPTEMIVPTTVPTEVIQPTSIPAVPTVVGSVGDPVRGEDIFRHGFNEAPPCITCHSPVTAGRGTFSIGPGLMGIRERAATRVEGETAAQYIEHSIRHPADFLVQGYNPVMAGVFGVKYKDQDIADLGAYLLSL